MQNNLPSNFIKNARNFFPLSVGIFLNPHYACLYLKHHILKVSLALLHATYAFDNLNLLPTCPHLEGHHLVALMVLIIR